MSRFCVIKSPNLLIRPHKNGDEILLNRAINESFEQLHQWMDWAKEPQKIEETREYIEYSKECWGQEFPKELPLLIFDADEKNLIGATGFNSINWMNSSFEMGYWVNIHYENRGFITEAVDLITNFAFSNWNALRLEIRCDEENTRSAAIPKRLGFILESCLKNHRIQPVSQKVSNTLVFVRNNL